LLGFRVPRGLLTVASSATAMLPVQAQELVHLPVLIKPVGFLLLLGLL
jgi:hypothetical protein